MQHTHHVYQKYFACIIYVSYIYVSYMHHICINYVSFMYHICIIYVTTYHTYCICHIAVQNICVLSIKVDIRCVSFRSISLRIATHCCHMLQIAPRSTTSPLSGHRGALRSSDSTIWSLNMRFVETRAPSAAVPRRTCWTVLTRVENSTKREPYA